MHAANVHAQVHVRIAIAEGHQVVVGLRLIFCEASSVLGLLHGCEVGASALTVVEGRSVVEVARQVGETAGRVVEPESFALLARQSTHLPRPDHFLPELVRCIDSNLFHFSEAGAVVIVDNQFELTQPPVG